MTSAASFSNKTKQIRSFILWEAKTNAPIMLTYLILLAVALIIPIILQITFCMSTNGATDIYLAISQYLIFAISTIFTLVFTVKQFSYLHNKRKLDMYCSMPASRATQLISKQISCFLFTVVPAVVSLLIVLLCYGIFNFNIESNGILQLFPQLIIGAIACITAYGLVAICCGTTANTILMFLAISICYPLAINFIDSTIKTFFYGSTSTVLSSGIARILLCPLDAFNGNHIIYWLIFSVACIAVSVLLIKKRKNEKAQSAFIFTYPCHVVKILVSFIGGMFLGYILGTLGAFDFPFIGFVAGFLIGSLSVYVIAHIILYKGIHKLGKSMITYAVMFAVVIGAVSLFNFDVFGYNRAVPEKSEIKSAGIIDLSSAHNITTKNCKEHVKKSATDFDDENTVKRIYDVQKTMASEYDPYSNEQYATFWEILVFNIISDDVEYNYNDMYIDAMSVAFKLDNGETFTRIYQPKRYYYLDFNFDDVFSSAKYAQKYSTYSDDYISKIGSLTVSEIYSDDIRESVVTNKSDISKIVKAINQDIISGTIPYDGTMNAFFYNEDDYNYDDYDEDNENYDEDYDDILFGIYCDPDYSANSDSISFDYNGMYYDIDKTNKSTVNALKEVKILNDDLSLNQDSKYFQHYSE